MDAEFERTVDYTRVSELEKAITIEADVRDSENGNSSHHYRISVQPENKDKIVSFIHFQEGPIQEKDFNGVTNEALLAIVADRLDGFQTSKYACEENFQALNHVRTAMEILNSRTSARKQRGVEGTSEV